MKLYIISDISGVVRGCSTIYTHAIRFAESLGEPYAIDRVTLNFLGIPANALGAILMSALPGYAKELARIHDTGVDTGQEQPHDAPVDKPTAGE